MNAAETAVRPLAASMRALMKARRMTQQYVADEVGVSQSLVSTWVRDENTPDVYQAASMAGVFGVSLDALVGNRPGEIRRRCEAKL